MRKIVLYIFTTLDGFIARPGGELDTDFNPTVEEMTFANNLFRAAGGVMFARLTYEGFVSVVRSAFGPQVVL